MNDANESKLSKYKTEEYLISSLLAKNFSLKLIQAVNFSINTYKKDMIEFGNENKKIKENTDGIIVIICLCCNCLGKVIVYPYFLWLKVFFGFLKQKTY